LAGKHREIEEIAKAEAKSEFWQNMENAARVEKRKAALNQDIQAFSKAQAPLDDAAVLLELAREAQDQSQEAEMMALLDRAEELLGQLEMSRLLSGDNDSKNAFVQINAGAGGTESQDWAEMLVRMYLRFCDEKGWKTDIADYQAGDEAGIKSVTFQVEGQHAYGLLKAEIGIHRLVRISPFDASHRRHTSFASVFVYPEVDDDINIQIEEKDVRIDVYRASGAGGQKVNKTSSAVRITHIPSGLVVCCQNERSQHKNKDVAWKVLKARLYDFERRKQDEEKKQIESSKMRIDFGSQIRSYVLHPYRLVKDHRTGYEMGNATAVLDGQLDGFIKAWLLAASGERKGPPPVVEIPE